MRCDIRVSGDRFFVKTPYSPILNAAFRLIDGRRFEGASKEWSFPAGSEQIMAVCDAVGMLPSMLPAELHAIVRSPEECVEKIALDMSMLNGHEFITAPYDHQRMNLARLVANPRWLLADEMGCGKTHCVVNRLTHVWNDGNPRILILCPKSVTGVWKDELKKHGHLFGEVVEGRANERLIGDVPGITIANYELLLGPHPTSAADVVILDECVPGQTGIHTPSGIRPICDLEEGDDVYGLDHASGLPARTKVRSVFRRYYDGPMCRIENLSLTPEHPVWCNRGYIPARAITSLDKIVVAGLEWCHEDAPTCQEKMCILSGGIHHSVVDAKDQMLRSIMPRKNGSSKAIVPANRTPDHEEDEASAGCDCQTRRTRLSIRPQGSSSEDQSDQSGARIQDLRQVLQSEAGIPCSGSSSNSARMEYRMAGVNEPQIRSHVPSGRCGKPGVEDRNRSGRTVSPAPLSETVRQEKAADAFEARMADVEIHGKGNSGSFVEGNGGNQFGDFVWNIETGTGNYFANGVLVHNCHRVKNFTAKTSKAVRKLTSAAKYVWGLSGTPAPQGLSDWLGVLSAIDPNLLPVKTKTAFEARYCVKRQLGPGGPYIIQGYRNVAELHGYVSRICSRVTKAECLDLPEKVFSTRKVKLEGEQKRIYAELKKDAIARLTAIGKKCDRIYEETDASDHAERHEAVHLTVKNILSESLRLLQVVGGFVPDDSGKVHEIDKKAKLAALADVIDESGGRQAVIWCAFRPEVAFLTKWLEQQGGGVSVLTGGTDSAGREQAVAAFRDGANRFFVGTAQAGGMGINLQNADLVIYYSRDWNLATYLQSQDRCHRIGTTNTVNVVKLVADGTVDCKVDEALESKARLQELLLQDPEKLL